MKLGLDVHIHGPVDRAAFVSFEGVQRTFARWFGFSRVRMTASSVTLDLSGDSRAQNASFGTFFSGGVDSFYTALENSTADTLILVQGFDIDLSDGRLWEETVVSSRRVAEKLDRRLIEVKTNVRDLAEWCSLDWGRVYHGAAIAFVAHMISGLHTVAIAGSYQESVRQAWGTHPELDSYWSTSALRFIHDGADVSRPQKVARISSDSVAMNTLRVCYQNPNGSYNCGQCEKCIRTVVNLAVVGALGRCATLPSELDYAEVSALNLARGGRIFAQENIAEMLRSRRIDIRLSQALGWALVRSYVRAVARRTPFVNP
ncbi:hypothetical protein [Rhodococcus indonesiensis]